MKTNACNGVQGLTCALRRPMLVATGLALMVMSSLGARAQDQGTAQKPAEGYQTLYLTNSSGQRDANDVQTDLRNMLPRLKIYYVATSNALSLRGSAEDLAMAQKILTEIDRPRKAYRLTYTISDAGGQGSGQHWVLIVTQGSGKVMLKQGSRVPIMTGSFNKDNGQNQEIQYQDVGMMIRTSLNGDEGDLRLESKVEQTSVADEKSNVGLQDPVIRQSVLEGESVIIPGKPICWDRWRLRAAAAEWKFRW